ncbi:type II toxin-antitoxin system Phd/YefM family antitoxin [Sphingomonas oryzagri]
MAGNMLAVPAAEVQRKFGFYTDEAMTRPVGIQRHGHTRIVMLSAAEYERLIRRDRQVLKTEDLDDDTISAFERVRSPDSARDLNHLMDAPPG